jgi:hypothetical protein
MRSNTVQEPRLVLDIGVDEADALARVLRSGLKDAGDGTDKELVTPIGVVVKNFVSENTTSDAATPSDS